MSEQANLTAGSSADQARWAALDSRNERLVDISDRLLVDAASRDDKTGGRELKAAS